MFAGDEADIIVRCEPDNVPASTVELNLDTVLTRVDKRPWVTACRSNRQGEVSVRYIPAQ